jgi:hypothetical protein
MKSRFRKNEILKFYLREVGCEGVDMTELAQEQVWQNVCEESNEPSGFVKGREYVGKFNNYLLLKLISL